MRPTRVFALVGARLDADIDLEPLWETSEQAHTDGQPWGCQTSVLRQQRRAMYAARTYQ